MDTPQTLSQDTKKNGKKPLHIRYSNVPSLKSIGCLLLVAIMPLSVLGQSKFKCLGDDPTSIPNSPYLGTYYVSAAVQVGNSPSDGKKCDLYNAKAPCKCTSYILESTTPMLGPIVYNMTTYGYNNNGQAYDVTFSEARRCSDIFSMYKEVNNTVFFNIIAGGSNNKWFAVVSNSEDGSQYFFIATAARNPSSEVLNAAKFSLKKYLTANNVQLIPVDQTNCPDIPQ